MLSTCRHYPQSDTSDQQVKPKQHYVPTLNLVTWEENLNMHTKLVSVANIFAGIDSKPSSLGGDVVAPNNGSNQEDSLEGMSSLVDDFQQTFSIQNVEQIQYVSPENDLAHPSGLNLLNYFSKLPFLDENLSQDKHENVNIMNSNFS